MYGVLSTHITLEDYFTFLQINECAGYGIRNYPITGVTGMGCGDYWQQSFRYYLSAAIQKAESRLEADRWLGFPIKRKYEKLRQMPFRTPLSLGKYVRGIGVETSELIEIVDLDLTNDPVVLSVAVTFTDVNEIVIKYPTSYYTTASKYVITPSAISIVNGVAEIEIPRCRLLKPEFFKDYKNDNERPNYATDTNFLDTVEVYRDYLDVTTGANLVWWRHVGGVNCTNSVTVTPCDAIGVCSDVKQLACGYVRNQRFGEVTLEPATYTTSWATQAFAVRREPDAVEINYMRGYYDRYQEVDASLLKAIIAIAHNNLPRSYCSCDPQSMWYADDVRPLEPPVRLGLGKSTWGLFEAENIIREFDAKTYGSYGGGML